MAILNGRHVTYIAPVTAGNLDSQRVRVRGRDGQEEVCSVNELRFSQEEIDQISDADKVKYHLMTDEDHQVVEDTQRRIEEAQAQKNNMNKDSNQQRQTNEQRRLDEQRSVQNLNKNKK